MTWGQGQGKGGSGSGTARGGSGKLILHIPKALAAFESQAAGIPSFLRCTYSCTLCVILPCCAYFSQYEEEGLGRPETRQQETMCCRFQHSRPGFCKMLASERAACREGKVDALSFQQCTSLQKEDDRDKQERG